MCSCCSCGHGSRCGSCSFATYVVCILLTIAAFIAGYAVYSTHMAGDTFVMGTTESSLALLVFVVTIGVWLKIIRNSCGCSSSGCSCGGECDCGDHGGKTMHMSSKSPVSHKKVVKKKKSSVYQSPTEKPIF